MMRARHQIPLIGLALLCLSLGEQGLLGGQGSPKGRDLFRHECAKCHGRVGEGVKGKYDDALHGDWALEKLTHYIAKSMPDDAPGTCPDPDAVARYIYDAFYSREARARNHPPRVELVRLTNRQYLNTVADLLKASATAEKPADGEPGLTGSYRSKLGKADSDRKTFERVDRQLLFSFGENSPDADRLGTGTNEISITWRGSVFADETGDHEFVVKTPNGARLWVNDEDATLIDAWVASGQADEHKASIRLLGGRAYPLKLEFFKAAKDKEASVSLQWKPPHGARTAIPARSLSTESVKPTLVVATPFPPDDSSVGYERGVAVSKAWDEATTQAAIEAANHMVQHLDALTKSKPNDTNRLAKVEAFCSEFVATAFRRRLTTEQKTVFVSTHFKRAGKVEDAVKRVVLLALKSPRFLYLGLDGEKPDDFAVAARLSFGLWDSLPDQELWKLAGQNALHTRAQVSSQARRMLSDPRARAKVQYFLHHWLQMDRVEDLSKDTTLFPGFTPEIIADLRTSLNIFLEDTVWNGSSDYRNLLLAESVFLNNRLAAFYGVSTNAQDDFVKVALNGKERSGVITHP